MRATALIQLALEEIRAKTAEAANVYARVLSLDTPPNELDVLTAIARVKALMAAHLQAQAESASPAATN
jgi:hypothetical protein